MLRADCAELPLALVALEVAGEQLREERRHEIGKLFVQAGCSGALTHRHLSAFSMRRPGRPLRRMAAPSSRSPAPAPPAGARPGGPPRPDSRVSATARRG